MDDRFRPQPWLIEQAFGQVMAEVDAPAAAKQRLLPFYIEAHRSGDPRREVEAVEMAFEDIEWGEEYFGTWRRRFEADGAFPYMWEKHEALCSDAASPPAAIEEALSYLRVPDMRKLLIDIGGMPDKGRPRRRVQFVEALSSTGATAEIVKAAMPRYQDAVREHGIRRERAKGELLAHTIAMRVGSLRNWHNLQRLSRGSRAWSRRPFESHCPVERDYAARHMAGELDGLPPFFPGDRTSFIYEPDRSR